MSLVHNLTGIKAKLLELCYLGILNAEDDLIEKALPVEGSLDLEETCDVPQAISKIYIDNCSICTSLTLNNSLCTDYNKC